MVCESTRLASSKLNVCVSERIAASQVNTVLNKARDDAGTSAQLSLADTNNVVRMVSAGSKGSFINISQVLFCVQMMDLSVTGA